MDVKTEIKRFINSEIIDGKSNAQLTDDIHLIDTGIIDSMGIMKLLTYLEDTFSIKIDSDDLVLENFEYIDAICRLVKKAASAN
jgi:acyl carrier protein